MIGKINLDKYPNGFGCTACGECCKHIDKSFPITVNLLKSRGVDESLLEFPYSYDKTGRCEKLGDDNKCTVYETRPNLCRIDWIRKAINTDKNYFFDEVRKACNQLMDENNVDESYRIK